MALRMLCIYKDAQEGFMRRGLLSILGIIATGIIYRTIHRVARAEAMSQKVDELQDKFRPLDTV